MHCLRNISIILFAVSVIINVSFLSAAAETNRCEPTMNDVEGPYYLAGAPFRNQLANPDEQGERVVLKGTVRQTDCKSSIKYALIEVWQTDANGEYYYEDAEYRLRGQLKSDKNGYYELSTVKPGRYRIMNGFRPAHIHLKVSHPDYETVITQLYFKGDPYLWPKDACSSACKSNDPRRIIALDDEKGVLTGIFDITLDPISKSQ